MFPFPFSETVGEFLRQTVPEMIKDTLFGQSEWQKQRAIFEAATTDEVKYEALCEMVRLTNNHWHARLTLYRVHAFRRTNNGDDTALHNEIFDKLMVFSKSLDDQLYGWDYTPDKETRETFAEELYNTARRHDNFHFWLEVCERMPDRAEEAARNLIRLMSNERTAHITLHRLEFRSTMRPAFWNVLPKLRLFCCDLLTLHHNWFTTEECEHLQALIAIAPRNMSRCPVNYRKICRNADCRIASGIRN